MSIEQRWAHLARLVTLHDQACESLALLRGQLPGGAAILGDVTERERGLAVELAHLARHGPADLREAARAHAETAMRLLA
ncbi:MAG: hypothetical protein LC624_04260 [Halobacteriales archaeon]|nr:hypothetical protein [Halobacteriales archaeon]